MRSENISTPIYVECDKMYRSKVCVQEFSYFVSGLDIQVALLQKGSHVIMITLLCVMQRASLCYYTIINYYYVIIIPGSIITHYYLLQSPELADEDSCYLSSVSCKLAAVIVTTIVQVLQAATSLQR